MIIPLQTISKQYRDIVAVLTIIQKAVRCPVGLHVIMIQIKRKLWPHAYTDAPCPGLHNNSAVQWGPVTSTDFCLHACMQWQEVSPKDMIGRRSCRVALIPGWGLGGEGSSWCCWNTTEKCVHVVFFFFLRSLYRTVFLVFLRLGTIYVANSG